MSNGSASTAPWRTSEPITGVFETPDDLIAGPGRGEEWIAAEAPPDHHDYNQGGTYRSAAAPDLEYDTDHNFKLNLYKRNEWTTIDENYLSVLRAAVVETIVQDSDGKNKSVRVPMYQYELEAA